jgi:hypothetical protein
MEESFPGPVQVALTTAEKWTKEYQSDTTVEDSKNKVKAFLIPRESLKKVLALNTDAVRAYIGLNDQNEKTLLFVGANKDEKGIYRDVFGPASKKKKMNSDDDLVVYDGTRICPPFDDPNSPL